MWRHHRTYNLNIGSLGQEQAMGMPLRRHSTETQPLVTRRLLLT
jgi:hypothetical protein